MKTVRLFDGSAVRPFNGSSGWGIGAFSMEKLGELDFGIDVRGE